MPPSPRRLVMRIRPTRVPTRSCSVMALASGWKSEGTSAWLPAKRWDSVYPNLKEHSVSRHFVAPPAARVCLEGLQGRCCGFPRRLGRDGSPGAARPPGSGSPRPPRPERSTPSLGYPNALPEDGHRAVRAPPLDGKRGLVTNLRALSHYSGSPSGKGSITRTKSPGGRIPVWPDGTVESPNWTSPSRRDNPRQFPLQPCTSRRFWTIGFCSLSVLEGRKGRQHVACPRRVGHWLVLPDPPVAEGQYPLGELRNVVLVGDEHDRQPALVQVLKDLEDLDRRAAVEVPGWFIRQQDGRTVHEGARNRHALLLAAREL